MVHPEAQTSIAKYQFVSSRLLVSLSLALTKGKRKHEFPLNKGYSEAFLRRFWSFLAVYFSQKAWKYPLF